MSQANASIVDRALQSKLLTEEQVALCRAALPEPAANSPGSNAAAEQKLLELLVSRKMLTRWQISHLQAGHLKGFFRKHYKLLSPLGAGNLGSTFRAVDTQSGRAVVVKVLAPRAATPEVAAALQQQAQQLLKLRHERIAEILDVNLEGSAPFVVEELIDGLDLRKYLETNAPLPVELASRLAREICEALQFAHRQDIDHLDLKPTNVLLTRQGHVKLTDLGLARALGPAPASTHVTHKEAPTYIAPECQSQPAMGDARSDIYSLGCIYYQCLTNNEPHFTPASDSGTHRLRSAESNILGGVLLPPALLELLEERMLALSPAKRFQTAAEAHAALEPYAEGASALGSGVKTSLADLLAEEEKAAHAAHVASEKERQRKQERSLLDNSAPAMAAPAKTQSDLWEYADVLKYVGGFVVVLGLLVLILWRPWSRTNETVVAPRIQGPPPVMQPLETAKVEQPREPAYVSAALFPFELGREYQFDVPSTAHKQTEIRVSVDKEQVPHGPIQCIAVRWTEHKINGESVNLWVDFLLPLKGENEDFVLLAERDFYQGQFHTFHPSLPAFMHKAEPKKIKWEGQVNSSDGKAALVLDPPEKLKTPLGNFQVHRLQTAYSAAGEAEIATELWLAPGIGPVQAAVIIPSGTLQMQLKKVSGISDQIDEKDPIAAANLRELFNGPHGKPAVKGPNQPPKVEIAQLNELELLEGTNQLIRLVGSDPDGDEVTFQTLLPGSTTWQSTSGPRIFLRNLSGASVTVEVRAVDSHGATSEPLKQTLDIKPNPWKAWGGQRTIQTGQRWITSVAWNPKGTLLAGAGENQQVQVYEGSGMGQPRIFKGHTGHIFGLAFDTSGDVLASVSDDKSVRLWNVADGSSAGSVGKQDQSVKCVAYSRDGSMLAEGGSNKYIEVWQSKEHTIIHRLVGHDGWVDCLAFRPDGRFLASGSEDNTVRIWNLAGGQADHTISAHTDDILSVAFSPDGKYLDTASKDSTIKLWTPDGRELLFTLAQHVRAVNGLAFHPTLPILASSGEDKTICLWRTTDGALVRILEGHTGSVTSVAFSPSGGQLASGSLTGEIRLWGAAAK